ncbi:hypothetical protein Igag_1275 [Ignisphaera aggregans DSM 17230]|uniref:Pop5 n=1 Tax=Ignisphaera aggregans (strain DSM 17230 / JCM 13409 / AQ1.S1) TaxID=583356 RepID=E0SPM4_IGNAA|nr:hypothetical protein Igag_1275 [Ignisphaera aggregans DSM 17230]
MLMDLLPLILSIVAIAIAIISIVTIRYIYRYLYNLLEELDISTIISRKKSKRVKRYIAIKILCPEETDIVTYIKSLSRDINELLGPIGRIRCGVTLISFRADKRRAILRVVGYSECVKHVLLILSIQHLLKNQCIAIPIKTSGLLTRIRKFVGYK